jgi:hypothetical protein
MKILPPASEQLSLKNGENSEHSNAQSELTELVLLKQALHFRAVLKRSSLVFRIIKEVTTWFYG